MLVLSSSLSQVLSFLSTGAWWLSIRWLGGMLGSNHDQAYFISQMTLCLSTSFT